jgi:hypothetical protein
MAYYKLKEYVEKGYEFNQIFPNKVIEVQQMTGMLFDIQDVVDYLQQQTNDFKIENPVAKDLDNAIYKLILKHEPSQPEPEEEAKNPIDEWVASVESLYDLLSGDTSAFTEENLNEWKAALELQVGLLELENYDAESIKKYKSVL